jgi:hypothetical protein
MEPINFVIVSSAAMVTQFAVIHMKAYCHLHAINNLVGHAWIVWVDLKSDTRQTLGEFAIVQYRAFWQCTSNCFAPFLSVVT